MAENHHGQSSGRYPHRVMSSLLLESGGKLDRGLPCVATGTVPAEDSVNYEGLLTRFDSVLASHQWAAGRFSTPIVYGLKGHVTASKMLAIYGIACHRFGLALS